MLGELNGIVNPTLRERIDKSLVEKLIKAKVNFGLGLPINKFNTVTRKFQRRRVNLNCMDEVWAADLIDMQAL